MPCYNAGEFVAEAVESAWAQSCAVLELICVDDGSSDNTYSVLKQLAERSCIPFSVVRTSNRGAPHARNVGTRMASGDYIQYLDADDILEIDKLHHQVDLLKSNYNQNVDLIVSSYVSVDIKGRSPNVVKRSYGQWTDPWIALMAGDLGITTANLWRTSCVLDVGGWDESRYASQEASLMFQMLRSGATLLKDDQVYSQIRYRIDSLWNKNTLLSGLASLKLRSEIADYLRRSSGWSDERRKIFSRILSEKIALLPVDSQALELVEYFNKSVDIDYAFSGSYLACVHRFLVYEFGFFTARPYVRFGLRVERYVERILKKGKLSLWPM